MDRREHTEPRRHASGAASASPRAIGLGFILFVLGTAVACGPETPTLAVGRTSLDLGEIPQEPVETTVHLANVGRGTLRILAVQSPAAVVYYNDAYRDCVRYLHGELRPLLASLGVEPVRVRDYLNEPDARRGPFRRSRAAGVPSALQGHLTVFISDDVILQGHVPASMIRELLASRVRGCDGPYVVFQDAMPEMGQAVTHYRIWSPGRPVATYDIGVPIHRYFEDHPTRPVSAAESPGSHDFRTLFPTILAAGLADGINPSAFAVLILFLGIMFGLRRTRASILAVGGVFIGMVYLAYLSSGWASYGR